jgi:hypothetical protein
MYDEKNTQKITQKLNETDFSLLKEFLQTAEHLPGELAAKLLAAAINGGEFSAPEQVNTVSAVGEPYREALPGLLQEENSGADFEEPHIAATKLREPLPGEDSSFSQDEIVQRLLVEYGDNEKIVAVLNEFKNKHLR